MDRHVLTDLLHQADLVDERKENGDPTKGGHGTLCLAQDRPLI
jgi:hypothetical protein